MKKVVFIIIAISVYYYLPLLARPSLFFERGNDLQEFFWPLIHYSKKQLIIYDALPLWNNAFFSGMPLVTDAQSPLFYPPNLLFLLLPIKSAFKFSLLVHSVLGGVGAYLLAKKGLRFKNASSLFVAALYITSPKLAGYLEAGHFGLITSWAWIPHAFLAVIMIAKKPNYKWLILLSFSMAFLFFTHVLTFLVIAIASFTLLVFLLINQKLSSISKSAYYFFLAGLISFGLVAISLLPQLDWGKNSTRYLLLNDRAVYPVWQSKFEFIRAVIVPWFGGRHKAWQLSSEKWITIGIIPSFLALLGYLLSSARTRILGGIVAATLIIISLNNASPFYKLLLNQDWYVLLRVSTRVWPLVVLGIILFAGNFVNKLEKNKQKNFVYLITVLAIIESLFISWLYLTKPLNKFDGKVTMGVYKYLVEQKRLDKNKFRVFCTTRCLSQQKVVELNLETIEGYNTVQQKNYHNQFIQLSQVYWDKYTLALPPFEIYKNIEIQPYAPALAQYNVKFIISPHSITGKDFVLKAKIDNFFIYENLINLPRAYYPNKDKAPITFYSPNFIRIDTSQRKSDQLILSDVYSPGWKAYSNGTNEIKITENESATRSIKLKKETKFVEFTYKPDSYKVGSAITILTIISLVTSGYAYFRLKNT